MDICCPKCGEPVEMDYLHDIAGTIYPEPYFRNEEDRRAYRVNPKYDSDAYQVVYKKVVHDFQARGCPSIEMPCSPPSTGGKERAMFATAAYELLGDDLDGAASILDDWI